MNRNKKPIERHEILEPLSGEHFHGLSVCWKIRESLLKNIEPQRIKKYVDWFWENYLSVHFEMEEKYIFPILGSNNFRIKKALAHHRRIKRLVKESAANLRTLNRIEEELSRYIRFEEQNLYNEIQSVATEIQMAEIEKQHRDLKFSDEEWNDKFWVS